MTTAENKTTSHYREINDEVDTFGTYLETISKTSLLSAEEEVELAKDIEAGLYAQHLLENNEYSRQKTRDLRELARRGDEAYSHFVQANLRLVVAIAGHMKGSSLERDDLVQHGNIGLMHAVKKFDYKSGNKFSTYATWWIKHRMHRAKHEESYVIALPEEHGIRLSKATNVEHTLRQELGREPSTDDVAAEMGIPVEKLERTFELTRGLASLNKPIPDREGGDAELQDLLSNENEDEYQPLENQLAAAACVAIVKAVLTEEEYDVLLRRAEGDSYESISNTIGVSRYQVRTIAACAIKKVQEVPGLQEQVKEIL